MTVVMILNRGVVQAAIAGETLSARRLENYNKLMREQALNAATLRKGAPVTKAREIHQKDPHSVSPQEARSLVGRIDLSSGRQIGAVLWPGACPSMPHWQAVIAVVLRAWYTARDVYWLRTQAWINLRI